MNRTCNLHQKKPDWLLQISFVNKFTSNWKLYVLHHMNSLVIPLQVDDIFHIFVVSMYYYDDVQLN